LFYFIVDISIAHRFSYFVVFTTIILDFRSSYQYY